MFIIFDVETTGKAKRYNAPIEDLENWPRVVQIAWQLHDVSGKLISRNNLIIRPDGFEIPFAVAQIHGITTQRALKEGIPLNEALQIFENDLVQAKYIVGHNIEEFDVKVVAAEHIRAGFSSELLQKTPLDTMKSTIDFCAIPGGRGGGFKYPSLLELYEKLFGEKFSDAHDAAYDVHANAKAFFELLKKAVIVVPENKSPNSIQYEAPDLETSNFQIAEEESNRTSSTKQKNIAENIQPLEDVPFAHLHNHSQFTLLQATTSIPELVQKTAELKMPAVALTDNGNMMGAFMFLNEIEKINNQLSKENGYQIKPIVGCELNVCHNRLDKSYQDDGYQIVFLAKNKKGYLNLAKLSSIGYLEGFYYVPRVDKEIIQQYKDNLIVLTGGIKGEIAQKILNEGEQKAEEALLWWKEQFGEDLYIELCKHNTGPHEDEVNRVLKIFAKKHQIKIVATNNTFYLNKEDAKIHDIFLCIKNNAQISDPIGKGRGYRFGFPNDEFYFKTGEEMKELFADIPQAIINIQEIIDKIEAYTLHSKVLLPKFDIPEEFKHPDDEKDDKKRGENAYLRHLTYEGAKQRYGEITEEIKNRLDFELATIEKTGYPGYFLIVQDFTRKAREMGVSVGPGRGSAAGSAVAYCIGITNVDPIKYDLLFERFLNPDRVSLPDIDIDFDDEGRKNVIDYVIDKYGKEQVAQIITYGTMAAKSSIRDVCRVHGLTAQGDYLSKLIANLSLKKIFSLSEKELAEKLDDAAKIEDIKKFKELANQKTEDPSSNQIRFKTPEAEIIHYARKVEGSLRNIGVHACGVIIAPQPLTDIIPMAVAKDSDLMITQFDNSVVESAGLLKMDFLGLKTLSLIKETIKIVKAIHGVDIDPDKIPLDDKKTYELFQRGETIGIFQYESEGMQKSLIQLKPDKFGDLIAMNALYRPGPLKYIPNFIRRKHGLEEITYDLPEMKEYLEETYGITVYQEQVMLLSQKLADFSKGEADSLRKAMGKKQKHILDKLYPIFIERGLKNGHPEDKLQKIWSDWEDFAAYAFNKSHSTCYAYVAFQTAYLKAHYPAEYMAAVLSYNLDNIDKVKFFMQECKRMNIKVLPPSVNESFKKFSVNKKGEIRFGLAGIKGVGEAAVESIIEERKKNGAFTSIYDFVRRINLKTVNKKTLENLAVAGAFDEFTNGKRSVFFAPSSENHTFIEMLIKYGNASQSAQDAPPDLFGETHSVEIPEPPFPDVEDWIIIDKLKKEEDVLGLYLSGHPLDNFDFEYRQFCKTPLDKLKDVEKLLGQELKICGYVTHAEERVSKRGNQYGKLVLSDYTGEFEVMLFSDNYHKYRHFLHQGNYLFIRGKFAPRFKNKRQAPKAFNPDDISFNIIEIEDLTTIREKRVKEIQIKLSIHQIDNHIVDMLHQSFENNNGNCKVKVNIIDEKSNYFIEMSSRTKKITLSDEILEMFTKNNIEFRVN